MEVGVKRPGGGGRRGYFLLMLQISENMMVHQNILSPQANRPVMGIVQDSLCGARKMTRRDVFLDRQQLMHLLMFLPSWNGVVWPKYH
jgi:DNA-directed RNA polymerase II subunit RPB1